LKKLGGVAMKPWTSIFLFTQKSEDEEENKYEGFVKTIKQFIQKKNMVVNQRIDSGFEKLEREFDTVKSQLAIIA
jgi:hypothetical protein